MVRFGITEDFSINAWVNDLETVAEAMGLERFALLGPSQGGAVAITYAVRHSERVSHLIIYGGYSRGRFQRNLTPEQCSSLRINAGSQSSQEST